MTQPAAALPAPKKSRVAAWALWDCGFVGMYAIVVTFVFSVYLTESVGEGTPGGASPASWLGRALAIAGLIVAVFAPVTGVWVQEPALRRRALTVLTTAAVLLTAAMSLVRDQPSYLFLGLALLGATAACGDLAGVPYNAMLKQLSTPETSGRISGFGSAAGYLGSVMLLVIVYFGLVMGDGPTRGLLGVSVDDGYNVRVVMVVTALWFAMFALPLLFTAHHILPPDAKAHVPGGVSGAYRQVWSDISAEWRRDRNLVYYLIASAIFSWLYAFNVVNPRNQVVMTIGNALFRVTEPALRPIRRFLPDLGGIDISPIILLLLIFFLRQFLIQTVAPALLA